MSPRQKPGGRKGTLRTRCPTIPQDKPANKAGNQRLIQAIWQQALGKPARQERREDGRVKEIPAEPPDLEAAKLIAGTHIPQLAKLNGLYQPDALVISGGEDPLKLTMADLPDEDLEQITAIFGRLAARSKPSASGGPANIRQVGYLGALTGIERPNA